MLNKVMKGTADAIREKTGKSEHIAPVNFAEEIKSISAGGGDPFLYYKIDGTACSKAFKDAGITDLAAMYSSVTGLSSLINAFVGYVYKGHLGRETSLKGGVTSNTAEWDIGQWSGVMYYPLSEDIPDYKDSWIIMGVDNSWITPCTKEEFEALITK